MNRCAAGTHRQERGKGMDFEQYYLDLFEILNNTCQKIAAGRYDKKDASMLFELAKKGRYPSFLAELAESFGMMLVKVEAREYKLNQTIEELEKIRARLEGSPAADDGVSDG